jgi:hypothetical protein
VFHSNYPKYSQHEQSFPAAFTHLIFQVQNCVRNIYSLFDFIMGGLLYLYYIYSYGWPIISIQAGKVLAEPPVRVSAKLIVLPSYDGCPCNCCFLLILHLAMTFLIVHIRYDGYAVRSRITNFL